MVAAKKERNNRGAKLAYKNSEELRRNSEEAGK
jgi:hypothetical protein